MNGAPIRTATGKPAPRLRWRRGHVTGALVVVAALVACRSQTRSAAEGSGAEPSSPQAAPAVSPAAGASAAPAPETAAPAPAEPVDETNPTGEVLAASGGPAIELGAEPVTVALPLPEAAQRRLREPAAGAGELRLALEGVTLLRPGVTYQVYLDLPAGAAPNPSGPHFLGHLVHFAEPGGGEMTRTFAIAEQVAALRRTGAWNDHEARVTLVPAASRQELAAAPGSGPFFRLRRIAVLGR